MARRSPRSGHVRTSLAAATALATATALLAGACAADPNDGAGDAPIGTVEQQPWTVMNNIDGYPNVAMRCFRGNGIYVTRSAGDSSDQLVVIPNDPACTASGPSGSPGTTVLR